MKNFVAVLCLLLCSTLAWSADKSNSSESTLTVHISAMHIRSYCDHCLDVLIADTLLNGKKIELSGSAKIISGRSVLFIPGDYQARLTKDIHDADIAVFRQEYEVLLPDGSVWHCYTSGISE
jgi:hypothetical protein